MRALAGAFAWPRRDLATDATCARTLARPAAREPALSRKSRLPTGQAPFRPSANEKLARASGARQSLSDRFLICQRLMNMDTPKRQWSRFWPAPMPVRRASCAARQRAARRQAPHQQNPTRRLRELITRRRRWQRLDDAGASCELHPANPGQQVASSRVRLRTAGRARACVLLAAHTGQVPCDGGGEPASSWLDASH
jgi:hypothetical protein